MSHSDCGSMCTCTRSIIITLSFALSQVASHEQSQGRGCLNIIMCHTYLHVWCVSNVSVGVNECYTCTCTLPVHVHLLPCVVWGGVLESVQLHIHVHVQSSIHVHVCSTSDQMSQLHVQCSVSLWHSFLVTQCVSVPLHIIWHAVRTVCVGVLSRLPLFFRATCSSISHALSAVLGCWEDVWASCAHTGQSVLLANCQLGRHYITFLQVHALPRERTLYPQGSLVCALFMCFTS